MPELPEVETVRIGLSELVAGQEIAEVKTRWAKSLQASKADVSSKLIGRKIAGVRRRGKVLIFDLNNNYSLLIHLKMTGQLIFEKPLGVRLAGGHPTKSMESKLPDKSTRVVFTFRNGDKLFFNDQRKFGWIKLVKTSEVGNVELLKTMGPEPLDKDFNFEDFYQRIHKRRVPIKAVITDQKVVAGVGNIYADEALHLSKIHPLRKGQSLTQKEAEQLHKAIKVVLKAALGYGGTSFTNFVNAKGIKGNYLEYARVFRREGQACPACGGKIKKIRVAGRGTHFCPKCQRKS